MTWLLWLAAIFFLLALGFFAWVYWRQRLGGLPTGRVIYIDTEHAIKVERSLFDSEWQLTGKPDYLIEKKGMVLPIEVKSGQAPKVPFDSHVYQLLAYCRLVETTYKKRPAFGIIRYANQTFSIDYTPAMEKALESMLHEIRFAASQKEINRSHRSVDRCRGCGYRNHCDQALN